jgi:hypothetical protein
MKQILLFAALLGGMNPTCAPAQEQDAKLAAFRSFAEQYRRENNILSFSYVIVEDGRIVAAEGIGWQDHDS